MASSQHLPATPGVQLLTIDADDAGQRLDNFLLRILKGVPKTRIYRGLRKGEFRVNKGRVKAEYRLQAGDVLRVPPVRTAEEGAPAPVPGYWTEEVARRIVYEDDGLLIINKPSGLAVHGGSGLNYGLIECLRQMRPQERRLELVHRLDRDTSGLVMVARKPAVLRELHKLLRTDKVDKRYLALVSGKWPRRLSMVEAPLEKNVVQSGERMVRVAKEGKRSVTEFSAQERFTRATLVEAKPVTGRTHQIRVHAQHAGYPLLGDPKYSDPKSEALTADLGLKRLFLHARSLRFTLPGQGRVEVQAPLDPDLESTLEVLRKPL
ncbi:23S rRNA pseudouridine(955/2504/2580) synthase RluC [Parahaliea mediterranea]|uniref:23S rRNA pseudouridine(955/2504/2580) synthase RluC n=1 Tax=Parahaliea mediterranea TaxID=651086 RepID=UPI000E2EDEBA|nr:23S rRNA pseudouridine(955/2504/2580) synthase RluC [Parahaliea mediterranea]